ncbi:DnaB-like helicase N-terminal domain-containing protein [Solimonas terrae]|uniref:DNA 5'-3' helicase n=1 Tax=Solimonas terrae TaxID=1396819 RepID=A0A6M2BMY9_9GAMM|nr:DnaB-like helicase N-terminal domain-containing protein [Solimonas terrae]NGY03447.1 hypothetical protein [Solimonas terrae]
MSLVSIESEADVLGGLMLASLQGEPMAVELAGVLGDDAFAREDHRAIYGELLRLARAEQPHDGLAVAEAMKGREDGIMFADIVGLAQYATGTANLEHRAHYLRDLANRRAVVAACHEAMTAAEHEAASDTIAMLTRKLDAVLATGTANALSFREVIDRTEQQAEALIAARRAGRELGVPFGIPAVDTLTGGMRPGELIGIAARTSIGKTALANQIAVHAATNVVGAAIGSSAGYTAGGPVGAVVVPMLGQAARKGAQRATRRNVEELQRLVAAGAHPRYIVNRYATLAGPHATPQELSQYLVATPQADLMDLAAKLNTLKGPNRKLASDALGLTLTGNASETAPAAQVP